MVILSLNSQLLLSAKEQVIWLMVIFISLKGSFPTIGVKSLSRFLRAGFLNSILTSHPVSGGGSLPPSISSGRYSSLFAHIDFSLHPLPHLSTHLRETKFGIGQTRRLDVPSNKKPNWKEMEKINYFSGTSHFPESMYRRNCEGNWSIVKWST